MNSVPFTQTTLTSGFYKEKQDLIRNVTIHSVYDRFKDTGRIDAFNFDWSEGKPHKPHIFWDSDVAKWMESVAYLLEHKSEPKLQEAVESLIDMIEKNQDDNGYFNIYFTVIEPNARFTRRHDHELYCAGHLIEAAVAYYNATGRDKFLKCMCKYADYIEKRFKILQDTSFTCCGHEEIELALVKLYECTKEKRYLELSKFFIDNRGKTDSPINKSFNLKYDQSHAPVAEQTTAEGHAVRAVYLYSAMADLALKYNDEKLKNICKTIFNDIADKKMYITGGIGSSSNGEAFTIPYDLPNETGYAETCAAIGLALFAKRMLLLDNDRKYSDVIEKIIYNSFISGLSLNGKEFFYENPLKITLKLRSKDTSMSNNTRYPITRRPEVFNCSCCPPNVTRFVASIADLLYTTDENTIYVHQFMSGVSEFQHKSSNVKITQNNNYPFSGKIQISYNGPDSTIAVRIPAWCDSYKGKTQNGYAYLRVKDNTTISLDFDMPVCFIQANPNVQSNCGRAAITKGPIVYCLEGVDNGENLSDIRFDVNSDFYKEYDSELKVPVLTTTAYKRNVSESTPLYQKYQDTLTPFTAKLIPYFTFANRGESDMIVWVGIK